MIGGVPKIPGGTDPEAIWKRSVEERLRALRIMEVPGATVQRTNRGIAIIPKPVVQKGGSTPLKINLFTFAGMKKDYILCFQGTDTMVRVAKPFLLRFFITRRTIRGDLITYDNYDLTGQTRTAHFGGSLGTLNLQSEDQIIVDSYEVGDLIYAVEAETQVTVPDDDPDLNRDPDNTVKYLDLNVDGRYWASKI